MDRLKAMRTLVRVAERGSFTRAAADLGLSHGMASAIVKALEDDLGVELIRRTTRRMALTPEGAAYVARARAIVEEVDALDDEMTGRQRERAVSLTLQVPIAFGRLVLAPALAPFLAENPGVDLRVLSRDRFPDMIAEGVDMLVYVGPIPDSGFVARRLGRFPILTAAAPDYLARRGSPASVDDLAAHDLVNVQSATSGRPLAWRFETAEGLRLVDQSARLSFESSEAAVAAAIGGAGVVQNIAYVLERPLAEGRLVRLLADQTDPGPDLSLVMRRWRRPPEAVRRILSFLRRLVRDHPAGTAAAAP